MVISGPQISQANLKVKYYAFKSMFVHNHRIKIPESYSSADTDNYVSTFNFKSNLIYIKQKKLIVIASLI